MWTPLITDATPAGAGSDRPQSGISGKATRTTTRYRGTEEYRRQLTVFAKLLHERGYVSGCDGNLSLRLGNCVLISPTGCSKRFLQPRDMVIVDLAGNKLEGTRAASSELEMHLTIYNCRPDVNAVVHAHPSVATGFASAGLDLIEPVYSGLVLALGEIPLAAYAPPGSHALSIALQPFIPTHEAILMENHGVVAYGKTLLDAYLKMETVEHSARIILVKRLLGQLAPDRAVLK